MQDQKHCLFAAIRNAGIALFVGLLAFGAPLAHATPYTDNFDALITDLQTRASALSNSADKAGQTQYKTVLKALATLEVNNSTSLATDIKNLGTVAKGLVKAFPTDFIPPVSSLVANLQVATDGLSGDVQTNLDATQLTIGALPASSCKDKANSALDAAQGLLDSVSNAPNFVTASKLLGSALKAAAKASSSAAKCASGGGGGGGGAGMHCLVNGQSFSAPAQFVNSADLGGAFNVTGGDGQKAVSVSATGVFGPGTYPLSIGCNYLDQSTGFGYFSNISGTMTITTLDLISGKATGTFAFSATQTAPPGNGTVNITAGTFNVTFTVP